MPTQLENILAYRQANPWASAMQSAKAIAWWASTTTSSTWTVFNNSQWVYSKDNAQKAITSTFNSTPIDSTPWLTPPVTPPPITTPSPIVIPSTDRTTITWLGNTLKDKVNSFDTVNNQTNRVVSDIWHNYDVNKATDLTQLDNQVGQANKTADANQAELVRYQLEKQKLADEEIASSNIRAEKEAANMKVVQDTENVSNAAAITDARAKSASAERELEIANDVELQKSNVAFAKLWLTLSTASITSAQQIFTTWVYNLSKLKADDAFKLADLQVSVAKTEFEHTQAINKIIDWASEKSYSIRKELNNWIHEIQNSLIQNTTDRQNNIDKAIDTYQLNIKNNEADVLDKMNRANDALSHNVKSLYERKAVIEKYNTDKINTFVTSWKWVAMTPQAQIQYEKWAWLPTGTVARQVTAMIGSKIYTLAKSNTWLKGITFSSWDYATMNTEAQRLINMGVPLDTSIDQVLNEFVSNTPEYRAAMAKANKAWMVKWSWGKWWTKASYTYQTIIWQDWKPHRIEAIKWGWTTKDFWVSSSSVNPNPKSSILTTWLPW